MVVDALRNGAAGYKVGKLDPKLVELVDRQMKKPISHPYRFWLNQKTATDKRWVKYSRGRRGKLVGRHFFFA